MKQFHPLVLLVLSIDVMMMSICRSNSWPGAEQDKYMLVYYMAKHSSHQSQPLPQQVARWKTRMTIVTNISVLKS